MKLIIDMNLSPLWVSYLQARGIEAQHWSQVGQPNDPDAVIFAWARENQAIIFTNDLDFSAILALSQAQFPSVFQLRTQNLLPQSIGEIVVNALNRFENELLNGALVSLDLERSKVRILPLI
jgi:predicted nuclease of predicted toxin-antitoxin system